MNKLFFVILLTMFGAFSAAAQTSNAAQTAENPATVQREKFDPARNPATDLQTAITKAQAENKRIILDVGGEWCVWCVRMDNFIEAHAELEKLRAENFVWLKINMSEQNENKEFLAKYPEVKGYPHLFVLDKDGALLKSQDTSELEEPNVPTIVPADVKDKEKYLREEKEKRRPRSYVLEKFTEFLTAYAPAKTRAAK